MAGIYIHIPFCRKLCYYCDFHFTVSLKQKDRVMRAIRSELTGRSDELKGVPVETVYLGGGTPSVLSFAELNILFETIQKEYLLREGAEITLEANPDDLTEEYLRNLKSETPVNRFSIGTQSFRDIDLQLMNRRHTAKEAYESIRLAQSIGFTNLNIDLIYGIPGMELSDWRKNLEIFGSLDLPHLSAYHLTFEPRTVFSHYQKKGKLNPIAEEQSTAQFDYLLGYMEGRGYEHYEISNFARPGQYSKHNLGYWTGKPYVGFGPSAHSFLGASRRWNIANNTRYCEEIEKESNDYFETEAIDTIMAYHEYIMTSLRTQWGIDPELILTRFGEEVFSQCMDQSAKFLNSGKLIDSEGRLVLSDSGKFIADHIISELMIVG